MIQPLLSVQQPGWTECSSLHNCASGGACYPTSYRDCTAGDGDIRCTDGTTVTCYQAVAE